MTLQSHVDAFHRAFGHPVRDLPQTIGEPEATLSFALIEEELDEYREALWTSEFVECGEPGCCTSWEESYDPDLVKIADALGDVIWTAIGAATRHGIDVERLIEAIAESNMSKLGEDGKPIYTVPGDPTSKILKGPNYREPDIKGALDLT